MSDLIDRDLLIKSINYISTPGGIWAKPFTAYQEAFKEFVKGMPSVKKDVPNTNAGKWIDEGFYSDWHPHHAYRCSVCGEHIIEASYQIHEYKYCFNCGARMEVTE